MNEFTIPAILVTTVIIAGMFAFMPVQEASTVHPIIQESSINLVTVTSTSATVGADDAFLISCPSGSDGCRILEIYLDNDTGNDLDPGAATVDLDGTGSESAFPISEDTHANITDDIPVALNGVSNVVLPADASLKLAMDADGTDTDYSITVIAETEANTSITVVKVEGSAEPEGPGM